LELCGVLLLAQLVDKVEGLTLWTRNRILLDGFNHRIILDKDKTWNTFVSNRSAEIHRLSQASNWHHVTIEYNSADYVSRSLSLAALIDSEFWWSGPPWLCYEAPHNWDTSTSLYPNDDAGAKKGHQNNNGNREAGW